MIHFNTLIQRDLNRKFNGLNFVEKTHKYYLNGNPIEKSVSKLIESFYKKFEADSVAYGYAKKYGYDVKDVKSAWKGENKIAITQGSKTHKFAEDYARSRFAGIGKNVRPKSKKDLGVVQFYINIPERYEIVELEQIMYNLDESSYLYSGTPDIVVMDRVDESLIIFDWKTNKELFGETYGETLKAPFETLESNNFNKYQLQLSFYQILLENAGFKVSNRVIVWLQEDKEKKRLYKLFPTKNYTKELRLWLQTVK